jgi:KaiC/GvpD/RAD55 family RecA-like ATPase
VPDRIWDSDPELHAVAEAERKRYRQHQANSGVGERRELVLVRFADMQPRLDGRPLVKGLLDCEQISVIYGDAGCGKTFFALDLGLHVAAGLDWFGRKVEHGAVGYVAIEAGRSIFNRVAAWGIHHGLEGKEIPFAAVTSPIDLCHAEDGDDVDRLVAQIRSEALDPLALLVVDTVSRALAGGNENAPDDMGALVRSVDRLRDELRCHVALIHHTGKEQSRGSRGHSLLRCAVDTEIEVARYQVTGISTATVTKQRDGATDGQIAFRLRQVELGRNQDGDPVTSCVVEPSDETPPKRATKSTALPAGGKIALTTLQKAIAEAGKEAPASNHIPPRARVVDVETWRYYHYAGTASDGDGATADARKKVADARKKAFQRAREHLQAAGAINIHADLVWITADASS